MNNNNHRRKERSKYALSRKKAIKEPSPTYLIICEGSKTEAIYFENLKKLYRLSGITLDGSGLSPDKIVQRAQEAKENIEIDHIACVFDKDNHVYYKKAIDDINFLNKKMQEENRSIRAFISIPCFEFWLLLHFELTSRPFLNCNEVIKCLKVHIPDYKKSNIPIFNSEQIKIAIDNANKLSLEKIDMPKTTIHEIVEELTNSKK